MTTKPKDKKKKHAGRELLALIAKFSKDIPKEELEKLPTDGAHNHDHYLYGSPKK